MGMFDKFKEIISDSDDDFDDDYDNEVVEEREPVFKRPSAFDRFSSRNVEPPTTNYFEREEKPERASRKQKSDKVLNIHTTAQLQVVLVKPDRFDEAASIADNLNEKRTVVLNLESTNRDVARRLLDFLSGVAYANNGQIKRVANSTYIITPYNVDVMGDLIDELENNGMF